MKFDDSDKDYFLHDFQSEDAKKEADMTSDTVDAKATDTSAPGVSPSFDFSGGRDGQQPVAPAKKKHRRGWVWFFLVLFVILAVTVGIRYFVPYITESQVTGYVTLVEKRGIIFRTFEGEMVSEQQLADSGRLYSRDVYFSIPNDSIARRLQQYQGSGQPVTITCKRYYGTLPWRGASNNILVSFTPR